MPLDDACGFEATKVREDVALRATELEAELVHRARRVGEVEGGDDLAAAEGDAGVAGGNLVAHALEERAARDGDGIGRLGGCGGAGHFGGPVDGADGIVLDLAEARPAILARCRGRRSSS